MAAPVNVRLQHPTVHFRHWPAESIEWLKLNAAVGGNPDFYPLTVKAAYILGVIHDLCESIAILLRSSPNPAITYLPAYGILASGVDLLGRCIRGERDTGGRSGGCIETGFRWLAPGDHGEPSHLVIVVETSAAKYSVTDLVALRNFAAHGQAVAHPRPLHGVRDLDYELLDALKPLLAAGLERYWNALQHDDGLCNALAKANVLAFRNWPVFRIWTLFERNANGDYDSITEIFNAFIWRIAES
jgi:hypothetical protein